MHSLVCYCADCRKFRVTNQLMAVFSKLGRFTDFALLVMRVGLGFMMVMHGYPKIFAGPEKWAKLGENMKYLGITYAPEFWGFMAAFAETGGGILLLLGFLFRPAAFLLLVTMVVAALRHLKGGETLMDASHAIELGVVFFALFILGPGRFSIDKE